MSVLPTSTRRNWFIAGLAVVCFIAGLVLSRRIEPGVRVEKVTLAGDTPALKFIPAGPGPHPVALLAHGYAAFKESLYPYGESLAAAGFVCYAPDLPGHGQSPRTFTIIDTVQTLDAIAREVGPVDVFVGHSMGGNVGGEAVREGGMRPGLFIGIGSMPVLGDNAPPLLLLAGRFDEHYPPALLKTRTDARVVISPWANHELEAWSPMLVDAAVQAACASVHKTTPPPTAWRWQLLGALLAILAASKLGSCLTDLFPQLARFRGLFISVFLIAAFMLTLGGRGIDVMPHLRFLPKQAAAIAIILLLATIAARYRIPRWSFAALGILVVVIALYWRQSWLLFSLAFTPALIVGAVIGWIAARRGSRLQGDIAMAIIVGIATFQWMEHPRGPAVVSKPPVAIKLNSTDYDACVGQYQFPPDIRFQTKIKLTVWREANQLIAQAQAPTALGDAVKIYPESKTNFFLASNHERELIFVKDEKGLVTAAIVRDPGVPDSEGKKLSATTEDAPESAGQVSQHLKTP